jgi:hypothetical protein
LQGSVVSQPLPMALAWLQHCATTHRNAESHEFAASFS